MKRIQQERVEHLEFEGLNQRVVYAIPKQLDSLMNSVVQTAIAEMGKYDDALKQARADKFISPEGAALRTKPLRDAMDRALREAAHRITSERNRISTAHAKEYAIPALDPTDSAGAIRDREIRERYSSLSDFQRQQLAIDMRKGAAEDVLLGLARDPYNVPTRAIATSVWNARVEETKAEELARLDADTELVDWAQGTIGGLGNVLLKTAKEFGEAPRTAGDIAAGLRAKESAANQPTPTAPRPETQEDIIAAALRERAQRRKLA